MKRVTIAVVFFALCVGVVWAQLANSNYRAAGGTSWVIGGTLDVASGGAVAVASGGAVTLASGSTLSGAGTVSASDLTATDDLTVTDDSVLGDDVAIGGDLDITGNTTADGTVSTTGSITSAATVQGEQLTSTDDASIAGLATVGETLGVTGMSTLTGGATIPGAVILTRAAKELTTPTLTFSVAGVSAVSLTADDDMAGIYPIGGALNQVVVIMTGTGSDVLTFSDGTSMTVGGSDIAITESESDIVTLMCVSADGDEWVAISAHDN